MFTYIVYGVNTVLEGTIILPSLRSWGLLLVMYLVASVGVSIAAVVLFPAERLVDWRAAVVHFWQARLQRKIGNDFREQVNYDQAVITYQMAEASFDFPPLENKKAWWWEWIELQLDQSLVYFYLSQPDEVLRIVERLKPVVEEYGTSTQRGRFYRRLVTIKFRQNRFAADDETIDLSRKALATIKESDDLIEIASAYFGLGLALFCKGDMDEAEEQRM